MPGLLRGIARTAVVAGTATAVSNRVSRRQAERWAAQDSQYVPARAMPVGPPQGAYPPPQGAYPPPQAAYPPPPPAPYPPPPTAAPATDATIERLKQLAELKNQGVLTEEEFAAQKARILA
jgi:Short C-terminal domain